MTEEHASGITSEAGFSLLEALIALGILAIASAALVGAAQTHVDRVGGLEDRAIASWVADEQLVELRIGITPATSTTSREMAGREWRVDVATSPTDDPDLMKVDIVVGRSDDRAALARLSGFVDVGATK